MRSSSRFIFGIISFLFLISWCASCGSKNVPSTPTAPTPTSTETSTVTSTTTPTNWDITGPTTLLAGEYHYGYVHIHNGGVLNLEGLGIGNTSAAVTIDCNDYFLMDAGSTIVGDAMGYALFGGPGYSSGFSGAGHGGLGGKDSSNNAGGPVNDNSAGPTLMGSGSSSASGGALLRINVPPLNAATLNGVISMDGGPYGLVQGGGGSGGSIYVQAGYIFGSGLLRANGEIGYTGGGGNGGGGGGGIVDLSIQNGYDFTGSVSVIGGASGGSGAQVGQAGVSNVTNF